VQKRNARAERLKGEGSSAPTMRSTFPAVRVLRIGLTFGGSAPNSPAPQLLELHPAARAFFAFRCPYANCDGAFDLGGAVARTIESGLQSSQGTLECSGLRARTHSTREPCLLRLDFDVMPVYDPAPGEKPAR